MKRSPHTSVAAEFPDAVHFPERRTRLRHQPRSLVYVELDEGNGGIVLNISEDGMAVQAVMGLMDDSLSRVRFQLSESKEWIEIGAQVAWANETRKLLGLRFVELPEQSRRHIRQWIERERSGNREDGSPEISAEARSEAGEAPAALPTVPSEPSTVEATAIAAIVEPPSSGEPAEAASAIAVDSHPDLHFSEIPPPLSGFTPHVTSATAMAETVEIGPSAGAPVDAVGKPSPEEKAEPVLSFQSGSVRAPATSDSSLPDKWSAAVFFLFLATASLAAGWAVGRGALASGLQTFRRVVLREGAAGGAVASPLAAFTPQAHLSEIEIVNVNNDRWTIPLTSSAPIAGGQTRSGSGGTSPSSSRGTTVPFRTWVLTPPVQPRSSATDSAVPPLASAAEGAQNAIPLVEQPYSIPAPPPPKQAVVRAPQLIRRVDPVYPPLAVSRHLDGIVKMHIIVSASGTVRDVRVLSGPPMLAEAAAKAASQWVYSPAIVDGKASDSNVDINIAFHLP